jgi:putative endonuclease
MSVASGRHFEDLALRYLQRRGLSLLGRNVRSRGGEVDLVMRAPDGMVVFVEVRARAGAAFGGALASVDRAKRARLLAAAACYLARWRGVTPRCRFDIVAFDGGRITWLRNAFGDDG